MADSPITICNLALSHLGDTKGISSFTDRTNAARACQLWYDQVRDEVLRDFAWPFAKRTAALALVATDPGTLGEWAYSYRAPADVLTISRIVPYTGMRVASPSNLVRFHTGADDAGGLLYLDLPNAVVEYTVRVTDVTRFPPDFVAALALKLAAAIAPSVMAGDPSRLGLRALELYERQVNIARANALNEQLPDEQPESSFITGRE